MDPIIHYKPILQSHLDLSIVQFDYIQRSYKVGMYTHSYRNHTAVLKIHYISRFLICCNISLSDASIRL